MRLLLTTATQLILAVALPYFLLLVVLGVRAMRAHSGSLLAQETTAAWLRRRDRVSSPLDRAYPPGFELYVLVPCLNEAVVISATVDRLLDEPGAHIVVIDDGSTDATGAQALAAADRRWARDRVHLLRRDLPQARQGKGAALNAGLEYVRAQVELHGGEADRTVICVMDADGRLSPGAAAGALACFADPRVGGVQLVVRIRNRDKWITKFQDVEFWMISACAQFARIVTGTVSLGGNGQFTRLRALNQLRGPVWSDSLTEDLDLGLSLYAAGWDVTTTGAGFVDQQGVESYRALLRQRTRWYQGHLTCLGRAPRLWRSPHLNQVALAEAIAYLLVPWVLVLPWSIIQQLLIYLTATGVDTGLITGFNSPGWGRAIAVVLWYLLSFLPNILIGIVYARRTRTVSLPTAMLLGHLMLLYNYVGYIAAWRAIGRMIRGQRGWAKTGRHEEGASQFSPTPSSRSDGALTGAGSPR